MHKTTYLIILYSIFLFAGNWGMAQDENRTLTFMNALEAKSFGFVDEVLGDTSNLIKMDNKDAEVSFYGNIDKRKN